MTMRNRASLIVTGVGCMLAVIACGTLLSGCRKSSRTFSEVVREVAPDDQFEPDETIGSLSICWPDEWTDEDRQMARDAILLLLTQAEVELGHTSKPAKLIFVLSAAGVGGIITGNEDILLVVPGECFSFPDLFVLLLHLNLNDPEELDSRWTRWRDLGDDLSEDLAARCQDEHEDPDGTGDGGDTGDGSGDGDDGGGSDTEPTPDPPTPEEELDLLLEECFGDHPDWEYCREKWGEHRNLHWWKHLVHKGEWCAKLYAYAEKYDLLEDPHWRWLNRCKHAN